MAPTINTDITVIGGGLAGLTQTLLLSQAGINVCCIEPNVLPDDDRTTAISYGSMLLLKKANIWDDLLPFACPIKDIKILDGNSPTLLDFDAADIADKMEHNMAFGWIISNQKIRKILLKHLNQEKTATLLAGEKVNDFNENEDKITITLSNHQKIQSTLVIGADGRGSFTRQHMNVGELQYSYKQEAIVCTFEHEKPHNNIAIEHFLPQGPFAVLPMLNSDKGRHQSALVWTQDLKKRSSLYDFDDDIFKIALEEQLPNIYGSVVSVSIRQKYPLGLVHAYHYVKERFVLIADAAHGIHPIAGQGLNLGLRDVKALTDILIQAFQNKKDIGSLKVLTAYEKERKIDNQIMIATTDTLNKLFSNNSKTIQLARKIGMKLVDKLPSSKRFLMAQAAGIRK